MEKHAEREVVELHRFFQSWFTGAVERSEEEYERVVNALADDFLFVTPDGGTADRDGILKQVESSWGARPPGFSVWIQQVRVRWASAEVCLLTYEEWQSDVSETRGRLSSALFRKNPEAPLGVEWVHLHETWLPHSESQGDDDDSGFWPLKRG